MTTSNYMPDVKVEVAFNAGYSTAAGSRTWTDVTDYVELDEGIEITHGRGSEFATCDPNHLRLTLDNRDGRFTAGKTGGAYYPNVKIGRPIRVTSTLPGTNYVTNSTFEVNTTGWGTIGGGSVAQSATHAQEGTKSLLVTWPTVGANGCNALATVTGLTIGVTYTLSLYVWVPVGAPRAYAAVYFVQTGTTSTTTGAFERLTATWTATNTSEQVGIGNADAATAGQQVWVDAVMVNQGPTAATFTSTLASPSTRFLGYVDEWPVEWDGTDAYAQADITASSRMARLGFDAEMGSLLREEILSDTPYAYYPIAEESGATAAGNVSTTPLPVLGQSSGSGDPIEFGGTMGVGGAAMPGATFAASGRHLFVPLPYGTTNSTIECFASFTTAPPGSWIIALGGGDAGLIEVGAGGTINWSVDGSGGTTVDSYDDGLVHHYALTGKTVGSGSFYIDGVLIGSGTSTVTTGAGGLHVGDQLLEGTIAHAAVHHSALSGARILEHAEAGLGFVGDTATERIIRYAAYGGIPSAEVAGDSDTYTVDAIDVSSKTVLDAMRIVETTENGVLYDARDNTLTFKGRNARYNTSPVFTLDVAAQEVEQGIAPKLDRSQLVNDVTGTASDGSTARAINQTSIDAYGFARQTVEVASSNDFAFQLGSWLTSLYGEPTARIPALGVGLITAGLSVTRQVTLLGIDIGNRITLTGLPSQAPASSLEFFVEGYNESIGPESYNFVFNVSPTSAAYNVFVLDDATKGELNNTSYLLAL